MDLVSIKKMMKIDGFRNNFIMIIFFTYSLSPVFGFPVAPGSAAGRHSR
jgi:hypothetical protein